MREVVWYPRVETYVDKNGLPNARIEYVSEDGTVVVQEVTESPSEDLGPVEIASKIISENMPTTTKENEVLP